MRKIKPAQMAGGRTVICYT